MFTIRLRDTLLVLSAAEARFVSPLPGPDLSVVPRTEHLFTQAAERVRQLAGDDPDLVRVTLGELRQHLQILIREKLRIGIALVDRPEHRADRFCLPLGGENRSLALALGLQDRGLLVALGGENRGLLDSLGL